MKNFLFTFIIVFLLINCHKNKKIDDSVKQKPLPTTTDEIVSSSSYRFNIYDVYSLEDPDNNRLFVSLSDIYQYSLVIPPEIIANQKNIPFNQLKRIELKSNYRQKLLKGTNLSETDTLYLYDYDKNKIAKYALSSLKSVANLNLYSSEGDEVQEYYYMIGFELPQNRNTDEYYNLLAYFGKENPFAMKPLEKIRWLKKANSEFPIKKDKGSQKEYTKAEMYYFKKDGFNYFLQNWNFEDRPVERHLAVVDNKGKLIFDQVFSGEDEGAALSRLNFVDDPEYGDYQWTGNLFKRKPPVIFDFVNQSFGCPKITFLQRNFPALSINCDNRH